MRRFLILVRPFGVALAIFILMNLALAIRKPTLSANNIWLYLRIREPILSAITTLLGAALLLPHAAAARPAVRFFAAGVFIAFLVLASANILGFYSAIRAGRIITGLPIPFSALIALILGTEAARVVFWAPASFRMPLPARKFLFGVAVVAAFLVLILVHIITFGLTDYTSAAEAADAVVVLGAKVNPDGSLSAALEDRMATGVRLMGEGRAKYLILSGGVEPDGLSESQAMEKYAIDHDVSRDVIIRDEEGMNTQASARNCGAFARANGFRKLLIVSQYYHNARVKLMFEREFSPCFTVPAQYRRLAREPYFVFRETFAFIGYLFRPGSTMQ